METVNGKTFTSPSQAAFEKQQQPEKVPASQQVRVETPEPAITKEQASKLAAELEAPKQDPKGLLASIYSHTVKGKK